MARVFSGVLILAGLASAGCQSHSIQGGLWELSFLLEKSSVDSETARTEIRRGPFQVQPLLSFEYDEALGEEVERVEIEMVYFDPERDDPDREATPPLRGSIEYDDRSQRTVIRLRGQDDRWEFRMSAPVIQPDRLSGTLFGQSKYSEGEFVQGRWLMQKIDDSKWRGYDDD